jgi:hypothetical protein
MKYILLFTIAFSLGAYIEHNPHPQDINRDGIVNMQDMSILLHYYKAKY